MSNDSAKTSRNIVPYTFKRYKDHFHMKINFDFGGGRYDTAKDWLRKECWAENIVYDPYTRSHEHNKAALNYLPTASTITCLNVLNVILDDQERAQCIDELHRMATIIQHPKCLYVQIYEGDKSNIKSPSQMNRRTQDYISELQQAFPTDKWNLTRQRNVIIIRNTSKN